MLDHEYDSTSSGWASSAATTRRSSRLPTRWRRALQGHQRVPRLDGGEVPEPRRAIEPSQIIIHVRMLDAEASLQQEALGIVGVNLFYGAFFLITSRSSSSSRCSIT